MNATLAVIWPFSETVIERLGWVLVHSLWQFALIAVLAAIAVRALHRRSASLRHGVLVIALLVAPAAAATTWLLQPGGALPQAANRETFEPAPATSSANSDASRPNAALETKELAEAPTRPATGGGSDTPLASPSASHALSTPWFDSAKIALRPWLAWIVAGWSLGVLACSLRPLLGWHTLRRLRRQGVSPAPATALAALSRVSERLGLRRTVALLESTLVQVPVMVGYLRPIILLPVSLASSVPVAQLEAILAHELAHVRRHDFAINLVQLLIETIFFYHPAVWWLSRRIRIEREHCCDDLVVTLLDNRVEYGRALVAIEQNRGTSSILALGAADGSLLARVRRILGVGTDRDSLSLLGRWPVALLGVALLSLAVVASTNWNLAAKDEPEAAQISIPSATLPNGAKLELLGISYHKWQRNDWWAADGKPLPRDPRDPQWKQVQFSDFNAGAMQGDCREFAVRVTGLPNRPELFAYQFCYEPFDAPAARAVIHEPSEFTTAELPPMAKFNVKTVTLRIGMDEVPQQIERSFGVDCKKLGAAPATAEQRQADDFIQPLLVEEVKGQAQLLLKEVRRSNGPIVVEYAPTAIDKDGNRHESIQAGGRVGFAAYLYPIAPEKIARFEYRLRLYRHWATFENVSLHPGSKTEVKIKVESLAAQKEPAVLLPDHLNVMAVGFGRAAQELVGVATEKDVAVRIWDITGRKLKQEVKLATGANGNAFLDGSLMLSADRQRVLAIVDRQIGLWETATGKVVKTLTLPAEFAHGSLHRLSCTPDLSLIASGWEPGSGISHHALALVWEVASGKVLQTVQHDDAIQVHCVALSHDGKLVATGSQQAGTCVWEVSTGKRLLALPNTNPGLKHPDAKVSEIAANQILCIGFSPDGKQLAFGDLHGVKLVDVRSGELRHKIAAPFRYGRSGLVYSKDGKWLARVDTDKVVPIWSTQSGKLVAELQIAANSGAFSDDGQWFAVGSTSAKNGVAVWHLNLGTDDTEPPQGLEFLRPYPKLHGLSLGMTEAQFLAIAKDQKLTPRKTATGGGTNYYVGTGDDHTVIVMFRANEGKCTGIQRVRGEDPPENDAGGKQDAPPNKPAPTAKAFRITGQVLDAETGRPIAKCRVVPALFEFEDRNRITWQSQYLKVFTDGKFIYETDRPWDKTRLRIEADGYRPVMTRAVAKGEKSVDIDVKLVREVFSGTVLLPSGEPAAQAQVAIASHTSEVRVRQGKLAYMSHGSKLRKVIEADAQGRFELPAEIDPSVLVAAHESGYAEVETIAPFAAKNAPGAEQPADAKLRNNQALKITLRPWGRVEGKILMPTKPLAGAKLWVYQSRADNILVWANQDVVSDTNGRFVIERIPAGPHGICQRYVENSDGNGGHSLSGLLTRFDIPSGKTTTLHLGSPGRTVIGKLALPPGFPHKLDWTKVNVSVTLQAPRFNRFGNDDKSAESWTDFLQSEEGKLYVRPEIKPAADGSFRIEGLPAAEYEFRVIVNGDAVLAAKKPEGAIGRGAEKFAVPGIMSPGAAAPIDLGTIRLIAIGAAKTVASE